MGNDVDLSAPLLPKAVYTNVIEERKKQAEQERIQKEEAEKKKKEEQEKKKKEAEQKKKEEEEKKKAESEEEKQKKGLKAKLTEAFWTSVDVMLKPVEDLMDSVLGVTIDPFTDRRYIAWLSLVTLAFNYNTWFVTARLCFPYHTESAIPLWLTLDSLADLIYLTDSVVFQSRKQFVKAGDIIVSSAPIAPHRLAASPQSFCLLLSERQNHVKEELQRIGAIQGRFPDVFIPQTAHVGSSSHICLSLHPQLDMVSLLPFDLLYFQFGFKSIFRANRLLKVILWPCCLRLMVECPFNTTVILLWKAETFFEFSDRLESIMAKAYIWR